MLRAIAALVTAYALSQFFRAFLAVLTPYLAQDLGASPEDLARASGVWFLAFAALQLPIGAALDKIGPRRTSAVLFGLGAGGGAVLFALASAPWHLSLAMGLIGAGCAPILMATYYIFARVYSAAAFATLAGVSLGIGCLGNIASSYPLAFSLGFLGWRETVWGLALLSLLTALCIWIFVKDPPRVESAAQKGGFAEVFAIRALWPIFALLFVTYAPIAAYGGLWVGPYTEQIFGLAAREIGTAALIIGLVLAIGCLGYGPLDRILQRRETLLATASVLLSAVLIAIWATAGQSLPLSIGLFALASLLGANFPILMAAGRAHLPPHLLGRGVTVLNLFSIGGVGLLQSASGMIFARFGTEPIEGYRALFLFFAVVMCAGTALYLLRGRLQGSD